MTTSCTAPARELLEGSEAIADAMIAAGCRFFAGYPMTPFTEVLEEMASKLPAVDGVCMNAESELEAIGMAWGAAATGTRAATGSTGQGLSLMQESLSEMSVARVPLVVLNMARAQGDYWQSTRGGGHGDYRLPVLAPMDVAEAVAAHPARLPPRVAMAQSGADLRRLLPRAHDAVGRGRARRLRAAAATDWALDGSTGGSGNAGWCRRSAAASSATPSATTSPSTTARKRRPPQTCWTVSSRSSTPDSSTTRKSSSSRSARPRRYVRAAVRSLRADGAKVGWVRPVSLVPFPTDTIAAAADGARAVAVYENNQGQMIDDVRLAVLGRCPVHFIGGLSLDSSGFGIAPDLEVGTLRARIEEVLG